MTRNDGSVRDRRDKVRERNAKQQNKSSDGQSGGFTDEYGTEVKRPGKVVVPEATGELEPEENP